MHVQWSDVCFNSCRTSQASLIEPIVRGMGMAKLCRHISWLLFTKLHALWALQTLSPSLAPCNKATSYKTVYESGGSHMCSTSFLHKGYFLHSVPKRSVLHLLCSTHRPPAIKLFFRATWSGQSGAKVSRAVHSLVVCDRFIEWCNRTDPAQRSIPKSLQLTWYSGMKDDLGFLMQDKRWV